MVALAGFAFRNYRSFGGPDFAGMTCGKINLIAGQNNSGKSNILRAVLNSLQADNHHAGWDEHAHNRDALPQDLILVDFDSFRSRAEFHESESDLNRLAEDIRSAFDLPAHASDQIWIPAARTRRASEDPLVGEIARALGYTEYSARLSVALTSKSGGGTGQEIKNVISFLLDNQRTPPQAFIIEGSRVITAEAIGGHELSGSGIIRHLLELQNPSSDHLSDREKFNAIQAFVRDVIEDDTLTISIPHTVDTIHVSQGLLTLPIENMGTGIHEVVILAAAATLKEDSVLCIEEPELHLHPIMQRKLLRYLFEHTSNQYFIATHSAHMLDMGIGNLAHVRHDGRRSSLTPIGSASEKAVVCEELGYRPSDLVQTNAVVWVEGPSDRIYLKHWLDRVAPGRIVEGLHYSIMFYGGGLLNALSPLDEPEVEDFISLRKLNRFSAIIVDSDRTGPRKRLNASKRRVLEEFERDGEHGMIWVTWGYTIENYVPNDNLQAAIRRAHPQKGKHAAPADRWENPLTTSRVGTKPSKVAIAREVVQGWNQPLPTDVQRQANRLVRLIDRANRHLY